MSGATDKHEGHAHDAGGERLELVFAIASGVNLALGYGLTKAGVASAEVALAFYIGAYLAGGWFSLRSVFQTLRLGRFDIEVLMLVAAAGAAALGAWAEGALLLFLFSIGHALEGYAMGRAKRAIAGLGALAPKTAQRRQGKEWVSVDVSALKVADIVLVRPNERIPADGVLLKGASAVNQAPVTGESIPVDKAAIDDLSQASSKWDAIDPVHRVFAGTLNGSGTLEVYVSRPSDDSAIARVVRMVSEAQTEKSPTQELTDRIERLFVPAVLAFAVLLLFAWVVVDEPFRDSFYRAMAVLVAASPCALAIATPSAVLAAVARAARDGVLVKGGAALENLGALTTVAFDKTGTLTIGRPRITDLVTLNGTSEDELLGVTVAAERLSDHPLAKAIVNDGASRLRGVQIPVATDLQSFTGRGIRARVGESVVYIGKSEMFGEDAVPGRGDAAARAVEELRSRGRTTMIVQRDGVELGVIGLMDTARPEATGALSTLKSLGMTRLIMISGDHQAVADAIAKEVGLTEARGNLMPEDKVTVIRDLKAEGRVAMVGDGVNDAPAMANATVGIAMGAAGSDVALETADVALMADDLSKLPTAIALSRRARSIIQQNLWVSLGVVALLLPATVLGFGIGPAITLHEGSTLLVVFNALRLLRAPGLRAPEEVSPPAPARSVN